MSGACVRWLLTSCVRFKSIVGFASRTPAACLTSPAERLHIPAGAWSISGFSTEAGSAAKPPPPKKSRGPAPRDDSITNVGRRIPERHVQVLGEAGDPLGTMHRSDVLRMMDETGLKLVPVDRRQDPPLYRLMSGKKMHDERQKLRETSKSKATPTQVKELTLSPGIDPHDLSIKLRQVESWLEKKNHVKITVRGRRADTSVPLDELLKQMLGQINVMVGFVSEPKVLKDGKAAACILRLPSTKELSQKKQAKKKKELPAPSAADEDPSGSPGEGLSEVPSKAASEAPEGSVKV